MTNDFETTTLSLKRLREKLDSQSLTIRQQEEDLKQAREEIEVLKAKLEKAVEKVYFFMWNEANDPARNEKEAKDFYIKYETEFNDELNSITIDSIKRGEK